MDSARFAKKIYIEFLYDRSRKNETAKITILIEYI
jgi:hypothetical protein